jgi:hypothetical protein
MTPVFCNIADARLIWGGNTSVAQIQAFSSKARCRDFCFSDKYSVAIVSAESLIKDTSKVSQALWRDTQPFQQQACSSPRVLYVLAANPDVITESLVALLAQLNALAAQTKGDWQSIGRTNEHLVLMQNIALMDDAALSNALLQLNWISAIYLSRISPTVLEIHNGNGLFFVRVCQSLQQVLNELSVCLPEKLQTMAITGVEQDVETDMKNLLPNTNFRIKALGQALDFDFKWDGYELLTGLCRSVD